MDLLKWHVNNKSYKEEVQLLKQYWTCAFVDITERAWDKYQVSIFKPIFTSHFILPFYCLLNDIFQVYNFHISEIANQLCHLNKDEYL